MCGDSCLRSVTHSLDHIEHTQSLEKKKSPKSAQYLLHLAISIREQTFEKYDRENSIEETQPGEIF